MKVIEKSQEHCIYTGVLQNTILCCQGFHSPSLCSLLFAFLSENISTDFTNTEEVQTWLDKLEKELEKL